MTEKEKESSIRYYDGQLNNVDFHANYAPTIKISCSTPGYSGTKWMDLNEVSAEEIVKRLIKEFKLDIK